MIESHEQDLMVAIRSSQHTIQAQKECIALFIGLVKDLTWAFDQEWESTWDIVAHLEQGVLPRARDVIRAHESSRSKLGGDK